MPADGAPVYSESVIPALLREAGFACPDLKTMYLPGPRPLTFNYWGIAFASRERGG